MAKTNTRIQPATKDFKMLSISVIFLVTVVSADIFVAKKKQINNDDILAKYSVQTKTQCVMDCNAKQKCEDIGIEEKNFDFICYHLKKLSVNKTTERNLTETTEVNVLQKDNGKAIEEIAGEDERNCTNKDTVKGPFQLSYHKVAEHSLLTTLDVLPKEHKISFDIKMNEYAERYKTLIHFSTGKENNAKGARIPGIWVYQDKFELVSEVSGGIIAFNLKYELNKWESFVFQQKKDGVNYVYSITYNGVVQRSSNTDPPIEYEQVKVYSTNRDWGIFANATIRNLIIVT